MSGEPKAKAAAPVSGGTGGAERALSGAAGGTQEEKCRWNDSKGVKLVYPHTKPENQNGNPGSLMIFTLSLLLPATSFLQRGNSYTQQLPQQGPQTPQKSQQAVEQIDEW